jgi:hypothetical protein
MRPVAMRAGRKTRYYKPFFNPQDDDDDDSDISEEPYVDSDISEETDDDDSDISADERRAARAEAGIGEFDPTNTGPLRQQPQDGNASDDEPPPPMTTTTPTTTTPPPPPEPAPPPAPPPPPSAPRLHDFGTSQAWAAREERLLEDMID